jgi:TolB-like protein/DNA-binding SARP family transcriptional activator/Tfp pilus assembly protein PilF
MSESTQLALRLLGEIEVVRGGQPLPLPASRKARALLIYLAVTRQPQRRDRLCAMFWDLPDDPRGALRSSLSKLRPLVDMPARRRILAERDAVRLDSTDVEVDLFAVKGVLRCGADRVSTEELELAVALFRGEFAEGLDLTNCPDFHAWCVAEREEARRLRARILRTLIERYGAKPEAALVHSRMLARIEATDSSAHIALLRLLIASGRQREAEEQRQVSMRLLGEVGGNAAHELAMAWRSLTARPAGSRRVHGLSPATTSDEPAKPRPTEESTRAPAGAESERRHIVVLPLTNMSDDANQEYFADGITEDIITDLSQVSALFVVPRNTAFTYKGKAVEIAEVAQRLKVGYVLQGSVRKAAKWVRVTVQLIDGATGDHLWSSRYDRDFGDIFALQDDISKSVVRALRVNLLPHELESIAGRSTTNAEAYECYLRGRSLMFGGFGDKRSLKEARGLFTRAAEIDPGYARAYAGIAECDALLWIIGATDISYEEILRNSNAALTFAPKMAEAHASKGLALFLSGHAAEAITAFERAIDLDPEMFEGYEWYGEVSRNTGQYAKAAALFERAGELRPTDYISLVLLRDCYDSLGLHEQAVAAARRAVVRIEAHLVERPNDAMALCAGAATLPSLGEDRKAQEWADRALAISPEDYLVHYNAACTFAVTGGLDAALERLEHVFSMTPRVRSWLLGIIKHDVQLDALRGRPDFQDLLTRLEREAISASDGVERAS